MEQDWRREMAREEESEEGEIKKRWKTKRKQEYKKKKKRTKKEIGEKGKYIKYIKWYELNMTGEIGQGWRLLETEEEEEGQMNRDNVRRLVKRKQRRNGRLKEKCLQREQKDSII